MILPLSDGYHLAYFGQARADDELVNVYVDAASGALLQRYSEYIKEVGSGKGAYGDDKKIGTRASAGAFVATDTLRPGEVTTYDMKGSLARTQNILNRLTAVAPSVARTTATTNGPIRMSWTRTSTPGGSTTTCSNASDAMASTIAIFGVNAGMTLDYRFASRFGVAATARFSHARVRFADAEGGAVAVDAGGGQVGAGLRVRF